MTVPASARKAGPYAGNGVATVFAFAFKVFDKTDVQVVLTDSTGTATTLVLDSDYSVALNVDQDATPGGSITYPISGSPLPADSTLTMIGNLAYDQTTDITNSGRFLPQVIENTFDRATIQIQQLYEIVGRTLRAAVGTTLNLVFPAPSSGKFIRWRSDLTGLENADAGTDSMTLQGFLADSASNTHGAAMVAVNPALTYPAGSVGAALQPLAGIPSQTNSALGSALVGYLRPNAGAVGRTLSAKLGDFRSVKDFGAIGDGVHDDSAAINATITSINATVGYGRVFIPAGVYKVTAMINLIGSGITLQGEGVGVTTLMTATASGDVIGLADGSNRLTVSDMTIDSSVVRTNGAGIASRAVVGSCRISNVQVLNQYDGVTLAGTDSSQVENLLVRQCYRHGILLINPPSVGGGVQWTLRHIVSEGNDGNGITVASVAATGVSQITLGGWFDINLFANTGYGIAVLGNSSIPIYGVRCVGVFSGQNGKDSLFLDSHGNQHNITNFYFELDGTSPTGRTGSTPPTYTANGATLTASNLSMRMSGGLIKAPSLIGLVNQCQESLLLNDICVQDCGQAAPNVGIYHNTNGTLTGTGIVSGNTGAGASQTFGIFALDCTAVAIAGYDFSRNATGVYGGANSGQITLIGGFPLNAGNHLFGPLVLGDATGGATTGFGTLNTAGGLLKNNVAYTNP